MGLRAVSEHQKIVDQSSFSSWIYRKVKTEDQVSLINQGKLEKLGD